MDTIGERIAAARKSASLSATALAQKAGITRQALHLIETGATKMPAADLVQRLAEALNVQSSWLVTGAISAGMVGPQPPSQAARPDLEKLRAAIEMVESVLDELDIEYPPATKAGIVVAVYSAIEASSVAEAAKTVVATMLKAQAEMAKT